MLRLDLEKENFKRYNNKKGYEITADSSGDKKRYNVFRVNGFEEIKYLPDITVENYNKDKDYTFGIINNISINENNVDTMIEELEKYLQGYRIAKESIEEFREAIKKDLI
ncbi:hypothetical protein [Anaerovorax sp. IOR16]|uniref:hypothetical protein n=1 Tax=Anaerovorax sp. IOR16 TaxID=2773458 RepID=UPI0019D00751|nr:hypothetical protein [Anaerovorax sp. IOR16]